MDTEITPLIKDNVHVLPGGRRDSVPLVDLVEDALAGITEREPDTVIIITREKTGELRAWSSAGDADAAVGILARAQNWFVNEIISNLDYDAVDEGEKGDAG